MASPHSESFYCIPETSLDTGGRRWYSGVSLVSASLSLLGSLYMLLTFLGPSTGRARLRLFQNPDILLYLAVADFIACVGVIGRSVALIIINPPKDFTNTSSCSGSDPSGCTAYLQSYLYFGVPIEAILRFGYIATFMWTLFYAVDTLLKVRSVGKSVGEPTNSKVYHVITWPLSAALVVGNILVVFVGIELQCAGKYRLIGAYFFMYLPLLVVMVVNPFLYICTAGILRQKLRETSKYTNEERHKVSKTKRIFIVYIIIFYVCWLPSFANLVVALITPFTSVSKVPFPIWIINAVCNPLQGFLNSLSYGQILGNAEKQFRERVYFSNIRNDDSLDVSNEPHLSQNNAQRSHEKDPLLQQRQQQQRQQ